MSANSASRLSRIEQRLAGLGIGGPADQPSPDDPVTFAASLGYTLDDWQATALRSEARRQLWLCCRQAGKTRTAAIAALHTALTMPRSLTLLVSPSQRQSGIVYRTVRDLAERVVDNPVVHQMVEDTTTSATFGNGSRIVSLPGTGQTIRGYSSPDLVIEDEAAFVADATHHSVRPMMAVSGGRLLLLSSPFGKRGHLWDLWDGGGDDWERVKITAYDVPRIPREFLEQERRTLPALVFASEYLCEFTATEDSVFAYEHIAAAITTNVTPLFGRAA